MWGLDSLLESATYKVLIWMLFAGIALVLLVYAFERMFRKEKKGGQR